MSKDSIRNNLIKMFEVNRNNTDNEIARLASVDHRAASYRRNGILNFGSRQMFSLQKDSEMLIIGVGGPPVVGP